jgi:hypothetical protein
MAQTTCRHCNAYYNSERELRDHMQVAHRIFGSEGSAQPAGIELDSSIDETSEGVVKKTSCNGQLWGAGGG